MKIKEALSKVKQSDVKASILKELPAFMVTLAEIILTQVMDNICDGITAEIRR